MLSLSSPLPMTNIFVFGSNLAGRHGKGAALTARNSYGAIYGQGIGRQGNSYAIPTKDEKLQTLPIDDIRSYILGFLVYAAENPDLTFFVTRVGCGLAGYKDQDIAPLFAGHTSHCIMPPEWEPWNGQADG